MPPVRLETLVKPACLRARAAFWLRPPVLQWTTISRSFCAASSPMRLAKFADRDERRADVHDLVLVRLADVEDEDVFLGVELRFRASTEICGMPSTTG